MNNSINYNYQKAHPQWLNIYCDSMVDLAWPGERISRDRGPYLPVSSAYGYITYLPEQAEVGDNIFIHIHCLVSQCGISLERIKGTLK